MSESAPKRNLLPARILDLGQNITGPVASSWLAAFGAEVIKVEQPGLGDNSRIGPPFLGKTGLKFTRSDETDVSVSFLKRNRGKKSITLDITVPAGREILERLLETSDVVVMNYRPRTVKKLKLGYEHLRKINPRLIGCYISGFGTTGPWREWAAYDGIIQAASGAMAHNGFEDQPPVKVGLAIGDHTGASFAAMGIMAALLRREVTGVGQSVDVSMFDCLLSLLWDEPLDWFERNGMGERKGNGSPRAVPWNAYPAADGYVNICALTREQWMVVAEIAGISDGEQLLDMGVRLKHKERIDGAIADWTSQRKKEEVAKLLQARGVPCAPVLNATEVERCEHVRAEGQLTPVIHPDLGPVEEVVASEFPLRNSFGVDESWGRAPHLGEHNGDVYENLLGLKADEIADLQARKVI